MEAINMRIRRITALVLAVVLVMSSGASFAAKDDGVLSVTGSARVYMKATRGSLSATVTTEDASVKTAVAANASRIEAALGGLVDAGINIKDVVTSNYRITIIRDYSEVQKPGLPYPIVGYSVASTLKITVRDLARTGAAIDSLSNIEGLEIGQLTFSTPDNSSYKKKAIADAIKDGKLQAKEAAGDMGVSLGRIKSVRVETSVQNPSPIYFDKVEVSGQTTVIPDDVVMSATVYIDYYLKQN
jgi:uncharacterized protein